MELIAAHRNWAEGYYRKDGKLTSEVSGIDQATAYLRRLYELLPVAEFSPLKLRAVRDAMIQDGLARSTINQLVSKIRSVFRWGVAEELIPAAVLHAIQSLPGLSEGRSAARETEPVGPVDQKTLDATLPLLSPVVADMIRVQQLTGMRPTEVCLLRPCDLDRCGEVWQYVPQTHKTIHRGKERIVFIGPRAQDVLRP